MMPDEEIQRAEHHDHARAGERGDRLRHIANDIVSALIASGHLHGDARTARVLTFHVVADHVYAGRAIDIPLTLGKP